MTGLAFKPLASKSTGATLVELIVTIVIMSIALVSLAMTVSFAAMGQTPILPNNKGQ